MQPEPREKSPRKKDEFEGKEPRKSKELPGEAPADRGACTKETSVQGSE